MTRRQSRRCGRRRRSGKRLGGMRRRSSRPTFIASQNDPRVGGVQPERPPGRLTHGRKQRDLADASLAWGLLHPLLEVCRRDAVRPGAQEPVLEEQAESAERRARCPAAHWCETTLTEAIEVWQSPGAGRAQAKRMATEVARVEPNRRDQGCGYPPATGASVLPDLRPLPLSVPTRGSQDSP